MSAALVDSQAVSRRPCGGALHSRLLAMILMFVATTASAGSADPILFCDDPYPPFTRKGADHYLGWYIGGYRYEPASGQQAAGGGAGNEDGTADGVRLDPEHLMVAEAWILNEPIITAKHKRWRHG